MRDLLRFADNEKQFTCHVMDRSRQKRSKGLVAERQCRQIAELDTLIERVYVDNVMGKITEEHLQRCPRLNWKKDKSITGRASQTQPAQCHH